MIATKHRIKRETIPYILRKGETYKTRFFIVKYIKSREEISRFATIVSTKLEKSAVERNKLRRRIYESIRLVLKETQEKENKFEIILIPKKSILEAQYPDIEEDIRKIITNGQIQ